MHCTGSGSEEAGNCPVCGMNYVPLKDHQSDGHQHDEVSPSDEIQPINLQSNSGGEPRLFRSNSGQIYLSWIEYTNDSLFTLQYAILNELSWSSPTVISRGTNWFVNWADFPAMVAYGNQDAILAAHWLEMSDVGTYDYDIKVVQSDDRGKSWDDPFSPHSDGVSAEHGFVSMIPYGEDRVFISWLDGRNTKPHAEDEFAHTHQHGSGAMTLRGGFFDSSGQMMEEEELDSRVCDCCQTSAAEIPGGVIVAYRDRSEDEIRDIAVVRKTGDEWSEPTIVYPDGWKIAGCPVNGPVVKSSSSLTAIAWFAMNDTIPEVKLSFSDDWGESFENPVRVDKGNPLGRIGLEFISEEELFITWLEQTGESAVIMGRQIHRNGQMREAINIADSRASRRSGFPVITRHQEGILAAWTAISEEDIYVKTALVKL
jgi:hypothetical protein